MGQYGRPNLALAGLLVETQCSINLTIDTKNWQKVTFISIMCNELNKL